METWGPVIKCWLEETVVAIGKQAHVTKQCSLSIVGYFSWKIDRSEHWLKTCKLTRFYWVLNLRTGIASLLLGQESGTTMVS